MKYRNLMDSVIQFVDLENQGYGFIYKYNTIFRVDCENEDLFTYSEVEFLQFLLDYELHKDYFNDLIGMYENTNDLYEQIEQYFTLKSLLKAAIKELSEEK